VPEAGERLTAGAAERIAAVEDAVEGAARPRVAALEWLDPVFIGGHWVPQMIELAGGEDVLGLPGEKSRTAEWAELEAAMPQVVISMPCGLYAEQAAAETMRWRRHLALLEARVCAVDAAAYFSRPGPRLVDGIELLGHLLHPELVPAPQSRRSIELDLAAPAPA
jgi:iron complex transport system substrate-binding protein